MTSDIGFVSSKTIIGVTKEITGDVGLDSLQIRDAWKEFFEQQISDDYNLSKDFPILSTVIEKDGRKFITVGLELEIIPEGFSTTYEPSVIEEGTFAVFNTELHSLKDLNRDREYMNQVNLSRALWGDFEIFSVDPETGVTTLSTYLRLIA